MNRIRVIVVVAIVAAVGIAVMVSGCSGASQSKEQPAQKAKVVQYTCPMHPEVVQDKPGKCPKCGMDLVEKQ